MSGCRDKVNANEKTAKPWIKRRTLTSLDSNEENPVSGEGIPPGDAQGKTGKKGGD